MKACTEELKGVAGHDKAAPINPKEIQYLLLLCKLESLVASPRQRSEKQGRVDGHLDRLEHERALVSAINWLWPVSLGNRIIR